MNGVESLTTDKEHSEIVKQTMHLKVFALLLYLFFYTFEIKNIKHFKAIAAIHLCILEVL